MKSNNHYYIEMYSCKPNGDCSWNDHGNNFPTFERKREAVTFAKKDYSFYWDLNKPKFKEVYEIMEEISHEDLDEVPEEYHVANVECENNNCEEFNFTKG